MKEIEQILEGIYSNLELRRSIVPLFISNPGVGKTAYIEKFAKEKNATLVEIIASQISPFEISGIAIPSHVKEKMVYYDFDRIDNLKDGDVLFFDELLAANPVVLSACLTLLEQRRTISGKNLPNIMIVAAANPQNQTPISAAIKERFVWYNIKYDSAMWIEYMRKKYGITTSIGNKLSNLISSEKFDGRNFDTPRSIDKAVNMIINNVPTPYSTTVLPILSEMIENKFTEEVDLGDRKLMPNEMISWIDLIKLKRKI